METAKVALTPCTVLVYYLMLELCYASSVPKEVCISIKLSILAVLPP